MDSNLKKRKYKRLHCHHCNREVSKSTWYSHYEQYFDSVSGEWRTEEVSCTSQQLRRPDFNFDQESTVMIRLNWRADMMMLSLFQKSRMKLPVM